MALVLPYTQDVDLIVDDHHPKRDYHSILFSLNWLSFGFALAFCSDAEYVYRLAGILDSRQSGFYIASIAIGGFFGCLFTGIFLKNFFGYKFCQLFSCIFGVAGWYMHSFLLITIFKFPAFSFPLLISARFLIGLSCGISAYIVPTCIAIAATPRRRHVIGILPPVFLSAGFLICLVSGYIFIKTDVESLYNSNNIFFKSIGAQPLFGIILNFIGLLTTLIFDEKATSDEWVSYITTSDYDPLIGDTVGFTSRLKEQFRLLKQPHIQRQLMVGLILPLQQLMGINVILFKATSIFEPFFSAKSENKSHPALIGVIIGVLYFITSFFVPFISHFLKRKLILYIGAFLIFITDVSLAFIYYFNYNTSVALPILGMFYIMVFCLSWGPFPWLVISEVFDARIRSSALTISSCLLWLAMFGITVFYAPLLDYSRPYGVFILLAGFSIVSIIFVHYFIPETKYLSLEEIQEYFKRQSIIS